jgi:hypothetical protein
MCFEPTYGTEVVPVSLGGVYSEIDDKKRIESPGLGAVVWGLEPMSPRPHREAPREFRQVELAMRILTLVLGLMILPAKSFGYPTAVVFSPTGEAKGAGDVGLLSYTATNFSPGVSPGSSWFGVEAGLLPQWKYGASEVSFGGLEVGFDLITPFGSIVKPVLNAKLGFITEGTYSPSLAVGIMEISPALPTMNYVYASATKTLRASPDTFSYGRITLGYGLDTGSRAVFNGTWPFHGTRSALMACYESPLLLDRVGLALDYLGGVSEISDTYAGVTLSLSTTTTVAAGAFFANDRSVAATTFDGFFAYLTTGFNVAKLFSGTPSP